jgi:hypothetical protein
MSRRGSAGKRRRAAPTCPESLPAAGSKGPFAVPFPRSFRVSAPRLGVTRVLPSNQAVGAPAFMRGSAGFSPRERSPQTTSGFSRGHFNLEVDSTLTPAPQKTQNFSSRYLASASTLRRPKNRIPFAPPPPRASDLPTYSHFGTGNHTVNVIK